MEIRIADNWKWITVDGNNAIWVWETKPDFDERDEEWEFDSPEGIGEQTESISGDFADGVEYAKDKIWRRVGDDWKYAGGQVSKELGKGCFFDNMETIFDFLGFELWSYATTKDTDATNNWSFRARQGRDTSPCGIALKAMELVELIKDAEGGKDEG